MDKEQTDCSTRQMVLGLAKTVNKLINQTGAQATHRPQVTHIPQAVDEPSLPPLKQSPQFVK